MRISDWSSDVCSSDLIGSADFTSPGSFGGLVFMSDGGLPAVPGLSNFGIFLPVGFSGSSYLTDTLVFGYDDGGASDDDTMILWTSAKLPPFPNPIPGDRKRSHLDTRH